MTSLAEKSTLTAILHAAFVDRSPPISSLDSVYEASSIHRNSEISVLLQHQRSLLSHSAVTVFAEFNHWETNVIKSYGTTSRILHEIDVLFPHEIERPKIFSIFSELQRAIRSGADVNQKTFEVDLSFRERGNRNIYRVNQFDMLSTALSFIEKKIIFIGNMTQCGCKTGQPSSSSNFLFRNGISFFYGKHPICLLGLQNYQEILETPLMRLIYFDAFYDRLHVIPQIAYQLLALGYGRRELHAQLADLPLLDENLKQTREFIHSCSRFFPKECHKLRRLVKYFDAGPLSLEQLSRIAIRRAVGGVFFKRHMRSISKRLPPPLFVYQKQKKCCTF